MRVSRIGKDNKSKVKFDTGTANPLADAVAHWNATDGAYLFAVDDKGISYVVELNNAEVFKLLKMSVRYFLSLLKFEDIYP